MKENRGGKRHLEVVSDSRGSTAAQGHGYSIRKEVNILTSASRWMVMHEYKMHGEVLKHPVRAYRFRSMARRAIRRVERARGWRDVNEDGGK